MIKEIKNKYYTYTPNEFLPIFVEGKFSNRKEFFMYKAKKVAHRLDTLWTQAVERAYAL